MDLKLMVITSQGSFVLDYMSGNQTTDMLFNYTVPATTDISNGFLFGSDQQTAIMFLENGFFYDNEGNRWMNITLNFETTFNMSTVRVDITVPTILYM